MSQVRQYMCEVCGTEEADHSRWLLVSDRPHETHVEIHSWNEKLAAQPGICHLCCSNHMEALIASWIMCAPVVEADGSGEPRVTAKTLTALSTGAGFDTDREGLLDMLEAVELALHQLKMPEEEKAPVFDA
ncbi:MAG: hypothetical protein ACR2IF_06280 [Terriglobales bacterium]